MFCPHSYGPGIAAGFGLIHRKSRQLTELGSSHCAGSSIWLLFQHVLVVSLSRFGAVVQAVKEHVKVSFFPSGRG